MQSIEQLAQAAVGQRAKNPVITHADIMQPFGCMSSGCKISRFQAAGEHFGKRFKWSRKN
jgi:hypothetical protein